MSFRLLIRALVVLSFYSLDMESGNDSIDLSRTVLPWPPAVVFQCQHNNPDHCSCCVSFQYHLVLNGSVFSGRNCVLDLKRLFFTLRDRRVTVWNGTQRHVTSPPNKTHFVDEPSGYNQNIEGGNGRGMAWPLVM
ncbi:hypothetical protein BaRGS_00017835 [Batillaria attramentaria]|uniref:Uncharacterized protein n=1 Tax=Batillaria attramentaria TaxID=370345 RepID=A0ABD0KV37_9CAEN